MGWGGVLTPDTTPGSAPQNGSVDPGAASSSASPEKVSTYQWAAGGGGPDTTPSSAPQNGSVDPDGCS